MEFKPFLRPSTTYGIKDGVAYTKTWHLLKGSDEKRIPLPNAVIEIENSILSFGTIKISSSSGELIWTRISNQSQVFEALKVAQHEAMLPNANQQPIRQQQSNTLSFGSDSSQTNTNFEDVFLTSLPNIRPVKLIGLNQNSTKLAFSYGDFSDDFDKLNSRLYKYSSKLWDLYNGIFLNDLENSPFYHNWCHNLELDVHFISNQDGSTIDTINIYQKQINILKNYKRLDGRGRSVSSVCFNHDFSKLAIATRETEYDYCAIHLKDIDALVNDANYITLETVNKSLILFLIKAFIYAFFPFLPRTIKYFIPSYKTHDFYPHRYSIGVVKFNESSTRLASSCGDFIKLWNVVNGELLYTTNIEGRGGGTISFSPDEKKLASGHADKTIKIWNLANDELVLEKSLKGHSGQVTSVVFNTTGNKLFSASKDGTIRCWDTESGKELVQLLNFDENEWLAITPEGYYNASPNAEKYLKVRRHGIVSSIDEKCREKYCKPEIIAERLSA